MITLTFRAFLHFGCDVLSPVWPERSPLDLLLGFAASKVSSSDALVNFLDEFGAKLFRHDDLPDAG